MAITADLKKETGRITKKGGLLYITPYDAAKTILTPFATLEVAYVAGGLSLDSYGALAADFGASGTIDVDLFGTSPELNKAYSAISADTCIFTVTALSSNHAQWAVIRDYNSAAYAGTAMKCLGYLSEEGSDFADETESEKVHDEELEHVKTLFGKRTVTLTPKLLQTGKPELDFLLRECREQEYAGLYMTKFAGLGRQYWAIPRLVIAPKIALKRGGELAKIPVEIDILKDDVSGEYHKLYQG